MCLPINVSENLDFCLVQTLEGDSAFPFLILKLCLGVLLSSNVSSNPIINPFMLADFVPLQVSKCSYCWPYRIIIRAVDQLCCSCMFFLKLFVCYGTPLASVTPSGIESIGIRVCSLIQDYKDWI